MNPPPTVAPLSRGVATTSADAHNEVVRAGDDAATEGRNTVWVTPPPVVSEYDVEDPIDYEAGVNALAHAEPTDDEVEAPYRSPFE